MRRSASAAPRLSSSAGGSDFRPNDSLMRRCTGDDESSACRQGEVVMYMVAFSVVSSSLLLINKICLKYIPLPSFVSALQFLSASLTSIALMASGLVAPDKFEWQKVKPYLYYVVLFCVTIYTNMRSLQAANVETVIVFRALCPLIVAFLDWAFLGRQLPSMRSVLSLAMLCVGAAGYVLTDRAFKLNGIQAYGWVSAYTLVLSVEMAYGKHIVGPHLQFASMWGPTLYTNTISIGPMATIGLLAGEAGKWGSIEWTTWSTCMLLLSCVAGVAISYLGWRTRSLISATCYTVLGVANKMTTVLANALMWDQHASLRGILCLAACLVAASAYRQAPPREIRNEYAPLTSGPGKMSDIASAVDDDDQELDIGEGEDLEGGEQAHGKLPSRS